MPEGAQFCPGCGRAASGRLAPGQTLDGKYEILEKIGEGGMGEVYKARHVHLDEIRIIKVTKPDALGEGPEPRRFQEEARIATLVRHPNVAALYDFSRLPDGSFYMVWEFIDGITLEEWLKRHGPLPAPRALEVARQVLAGLAQIHAQGIVHRDLAPDNIMLREGKDGRLQAKIIDLGIAKRVAGETGKTMTSTGMFVGKLKYCSPEQAGALPAGEKVDARSDLYSFGVVLYEMLTGRPPFQSDTPEGYLGKHLHATPPPLDTSRLPERMGPALSSIVTRALEKRRDRRFRDAEDFASALAGVASAEKELPEGAPTIVSGSPRRFPVAAVVVAAVIVAAALAAYGIVHREDSRAPGPAPTPAEAPLTVPTPTSSPAPDDVVRGPRIVEQPTPAEGIVRTVPRPAPTRVPTSPPPPTEAPAPPPTTAPLAGPASAPTTPLPLRVPGEGELTEKKLRRIVQNWTTLPLERRANQAVRTAYLANSWAVSHPGDVFSAEVRSTLTKSLKDDAETAASQGRPFLAMEFTVAYLQLNPNDSQALEKLREMRSRMRPGGRGRRGGE